MKLFEEMRRLIKDASIYGLSSVIGRAVSLFMAPVMTHIFLPADYGIISLIQLAIAFFVMMAGMNIASGMSYYYYHYEADDDKKAALTTGFSMITLFSAVISVLLYVFADEAAALLQIRQEAKIIDPVFATYLRIAALGLFFSLTASGVQSIIFVLRKPRQFLIMQIVEIAVQVSMVLLLVMYLRVGIGGVFWASALGSGFGLLVGLFFIVGNLGSRFSMPILAVILLYSLPQLPSVALNWMQTQMGRLFINYYSTLNEVGLYSIAFTLASVLIIVVSAFRMAYDPYALSIMDRPDAKNIYSRVYTLYAVAFSCLFGGIAAFAKPLLMILTPPVYHEAHILVPFLAAAGFYLGANNIMATGIWISRKTSRTSYAQCLSFMTLVIASFLLVPLYGGVGAAIAYLSSIVVQSFAYYYFAQKLWPIDYEYWKVHGLALGIFTISLIHTYIVDSMDLISSIGMACITSVLVLAIGWLVGLSKDDRDFAIQSLLEFRHRKVLCD